MFSSPSSIIPDTIVNNINNSSSSTTTTSIKNTTTIVNPNINNSGRAPTAFFFGGVSPQLSPIQPFLFPAQSFDPNKNKNSQIINSTTTPSVFAPSNNITATTSNDFNSSTKTVTFSHPIEFSSSRPAVSSNSTSSNTSTSSSNTSTSSNNTIPTTPNIMQKKASKKKEVVVNDSNSEGLVEPKKKRIAKCVRKNQIICCGNDKCKTSETPLWRKGWPNSTNGKAVMLCNACGLHYKKGHFCPHCKQIYKESDADDLTNPWIGCDRCSRWCHKNCEERVLEEEKEISDQQREGESETLPNNNDNTTVLEKQRKSGTYLCPFCRNLKKESPEKFEAGEDVGKKRRKKPKLDKTEKLGKSEKKPKERKNKATKDAKLMAARRASLPANLATAPPSVIEAAASLNQIQFGASSSIFEENIRGQKKQRKEESLSSRDLLPSMNSLMLENNNNYYVNPNAVSNYSNNNNNNVVGMKSFEEENKMAAATLLNLADVVSSRRYSTCSTSTDVSTDENDDDIVDPNDCEDVEISTKNEDEDDPELKESERNESYQNSPRLNYRRFSSSAVPSSSLRMIQMQNKLNEIRSKPQIQLDLPPEPIILPAINSFTMNQQQPSKSISQKEQLPSTNSFTMNQQNNNGNNLYGFNPMKSNDDTANILKSFNSAFVKSLDMSTRINNPNSTTYSSLPSSASNTQISNNSSNNSNIPSPLPNSSTYSFNP